jgi:hypothetical protein
MAKATTKTRLNIEELKDVVKYIVGNNRYLQQNGKTPISIEVQGGAGLGKTSAIKQVANELGLELVRLNLAEIEELGDLVGFPIKEHEVVKGEEVKWVAEATLMYYVSAGYTPTGQFKMGYAEPEFIQGKKNGVILLLDDYSRADQRFMQATMTLIETQTYKSWSLPPDSHIILTSNPDDGDYYVTTLDQAQKTRFISFDVQFDVKTWARWAEREKIDGRCINFLLSHPEVIAKDVNPRSVTTFFNAISSLGDFSSTENLVKIEMIGQGSVGGDFSKVFTIFLHNKLDKLISPHDILFHENESYVVGQLTACTGKIGDKNYRSDIAAILNTRMMNYAILHAESKPVDDALIKRIIRITVDGETFTNDLKYHMIRSLLKANTPKFSKLMQHAEILKIASK